MLQEVFYWVFNMSITAAVTGVLVMLIRSVKRIPRRITVFLWAIPLLRMVCPIGMNSPYSLMTLLSGLRIKTVVVYRIYRPVNNIYFTMTNSIGVADTYYPITYKVDILEDVFGAASVIWIVIALAIILMLAITYITTVYEIKDSVHLKDNIYFSDKIVSPAVYGIIKPKIILPAEYKTKDIDLVILHEKTHIRSADNLWRIIAFVVVAVHWFNPICWLLLKWFLSDLELACDERVLAKLGADHAKEYALSLLESAKGTTVFASAFGGAKIRTRIENILSFKKLTWVSLTVFTAFICTIFYVLLTNAG